MRFIALVSLLLWMGCKPISTKTDSNDSYFDLPGFSESLLASQIKAKSKVLKTIQVNDKEEQNNLLADSLFWATELSPLLKGNMNKPSLVGGYSVQTNIPEQASNLLKTVYTALPETHTSITSLEVKYLVTDTEVRQIIVQFESKNSVYTTEQVVQLWVNKYGNQLLIDSVSTQGFNKTILLDSMKYFSKVVVIR